VQVDELKVPGAWSFTPRQFPDPRGVFLEWFKADALEQVLGHRLHVAQANHSVSARGTLRGVHFADVPPSQAKYVYCTRGAVLDVVVDLRVGSPTFGVSDSVLLDDPDRRGIYCPRGSATPFLALTDDANVTYLCSARTHPDASTASPRSTRRSPCPGRTNVEPLLSDKDAAARRWSRPGARGCSPTGRPARRLREPARGRHPPSGAGQ
jgi:dTDP-4-dehydrorhamnose 3,5-epimerase